VDNPFLAVNLGDLSLTTLVFPSDNANLVIFADRKRTSLNIPNFDEYALLSEVRPPHVVFGTELLGESRRHNLTADRGRGRKVGLARLAPGGRNV